MSITREQLAAARRYAPPLVVDVQADRRGARVRTVNPRAVAYAEAAGIPLAHVYPDAPGTLAALEGDTFGGEAPAPAVAAPRARWSWAWAAGGAVLGAAVGGPVWALVGGVLGGGLR